MSATDKLISARAALVLEEPFFGALVLGLELKEDRTCKTAWVDGRTIGYNPSFINSLTHQQIMGTLAHEVMHCASGHPWRRDNRDFKRWNLACDRAINNVLTESGFKLPENCEYASGDEIGKSAEWIFNRLPEPEPNEDGESESESGNSGNSESEDGENGDTGDSGESDGIGEGNDLGEVRDAPTASEDGEEVPSEADWQQAVQQAAIQAKAQGKLPAGLARFAGEAVKPRVDWRSILRRFIQTYATSDYSWKSPNQRYVSSGLYLPALQSQQLGEIAVAIDTSGSMDELALAAAKSELEEIMAETHPSKVIVYYADSSIARIDEFSGDEPITWNPCGGGGTDFRPVFTDAEMRDTLPACLIYITDMVGSFPESSSIPTLWVSDGSRTAPAPFGEVVTIAD